MGEFVYCRGSIVWPWAMDEAASAHAATTAAGATVRRPGECGFRLVSLTCRRPPVSEVERRVATPVVAGHGPLVSCAVAAWTKGYLPMSGTRSRFGELDHRRWEAGHASNG